MTSVRSLEEPVRVLHVDDDRTFTRLTRATLKELDDDIELRSENDPAAVLDRLASRKIECVVSDYQMPEIDGLDLLARVREKYDGLPFILFTGQGNETVASEAISVGVTDYVSKDGGIEQFELLANRIRGAVEQRRTERVLAETRVRDDTLLETAPNAIFVVDAEEGTLLEVNEAASELLGRPREELRGLHQTELHPPEDRDRYERIFAEHAESRGVIHDDRDLFVVHDDGHRIPVEISAGPVELDGRRLVQAIFRDLRERR
ncbi:response regulator [Halalkalicoccus ordinarius]|uniref:response regulator n=1 Tax=Halalkalicoccus ordinarius TaxID=3116651 RepID=UPI00300F5D3E